MVLDAEGLKVWRGERPKAKDDGSGEVDKSATLMKIARVLFDAGANKRVVVEALAERDRALGYMKYAVNRDNGRREYERIFEKLDASGRNAPPGFAGEDGAGEPDGASPPEGVGTVLSEVQQDSDRSR